MRELRRAYAATRGGVSNTLSIRPLRGLLMTDPLLDGLQRFFGFGEFRPLQREVIEHLRGGEDALVLMPTGGGKSLCYQLPALLGEGLTLVVSPLIALMQDQVRALRANGAAADFLNSTLSSQEAFQVEVRVRRGETRLLYVAPERVNTEGFANLMDAASPELIAIDEAHCISQWGHQFRPDYRQLAQLTSRFAETPVAALTATATDRVAADIVQQLGRPGIRKFRSGYNRPNLTYRVVPKKKAAERLVRLLARDPEASTIVYTLKRVDTESTAERLRDAGIAAKAYHAGLPGPLRQQVQDEFTRDEVAVICATVAFGMGVDKPDVRRVIHLDMPESIETYYQETGRAGRDGDPAECVLFYTPGVWHQRKFFLDQLEDEDERERAFGRLRQMMNYCALSSCRRSVLLRYFGDAAPDGGCGGCDNCLRDGDPTEPRDGDRRVADPRRVVGPNVDTQGRLDAASSDSPLLASRRTSANDGGEDASALFERLRELRRELASAAGQPPYIVASDRSLRAMAEARPRTRAELLAVHGFGPAKVERYGAELLAVFGGLIEDQPPSPPASEPPGEPAPRGGATDQPAGKSWELTLQLWREGCTLLSIAERRMLAPASVLTHLVTAMSEGEPVDLDPELPAPERFDKIAAALEQTDTVSAAHELLRARFSMLEVRLVHVYLASAASGAAG